MKKIINSVLLIVLSIFMFTNNIIVTASDTLITVGEMKVTAETTIADIEKVLGEAKIKTISPFGGYAYTFYTDDDYSNYLYIETTADDKIISYGSVDESYNVPGENNNNNKYIENTNELSGYFYTDENNKVIGGIYYNPRVLYDGDTEQIRRLYNLNYDKYTEDYQYSISKHAVTMINALSRRLERKIDFKFSDSLSNYYSFKVDDLPSSLKENELAVTDFNFSSIIACTLNPMYFATLIKDKINMDISEKNIPLFGYDKENRKLYSYIMNESIADDIANSINGRTLYAMNLLDDEMTETEKALILAQFVQEGYLFPASYSDGYKYSNEISQTGGTTQNFLELANIAGLSCEKLVHNDVEILFGLVCNLDDEWTYLDVIKESANSFEAHPYQKIKFNMLFKSRTTIENSSLKNKYDFNDINEEISYGTIFSGHYPEGVDKNIDDYASRIYYDKEYKYYEKSENKKTYIYKENRKTGYKEQLQEVYYNFNGSGLVKDDKLLYYVGTDNCLYTYNIITLENEQIASPNDVDKKIMGVFLGYDGDIYYTVYTEATNETKVININKKVSDWPKEKPYYSEDNKYKLVYLETPTNVSILEYKDLSGDSTTSYELKIPDTINNKPVVGIEPNAFIYKHLHGSFLAPQDLEYIGPNAFFGIAEIDNIKLNSKLKC